MKKLLKIITPLIVIILFIILYVSDNECSLIGASRSIYIPNVQHLYIGRIVSIYRTCSIYISNVTDI